MSLETMAAKKGIEVSARAIKAIALVALIAAVCSLSWCTADRVATLRAENAGLREFKATVQRREQLSEAADSALQTAKTQEAAESQQQAEVVVIHDRATREAAREDPLSADFLRTRIPDRLRRADREAREAREPHRSR